MPQLEKKSINIAPMFISASFTIAEIWKQRKCASVDEWIKKKAVVLLFYYSCPNFPPFALL